MSISTQITELNNNINDLKSIKQNIKKAINTDFNIITNEKLEDYADIIKNTFETYKDYIPFTETEQATEITVNDAMEYSKNELELFGNTFQNQYEGYNLLNVSNKTFSSSGSDQNIFNTFSIDSTKNYKLSFDYEYVNIQTSSTGALIMLQKNSNYQSLAGTSAATSGTITQSISGTSQIRAYITTRLTGGGIKISNVMLYEGTEDKSFEPYVGGQSSPSSSYPQTIHNVSGNNQIKIQNKNWFDETLLANYLNEDYYEFTTAQIRATTFINLLKSIKFSENTQYTFSCRGYFINGVYARVRFYYTDGTYSNASIPQTNEGTVTLTSLEGKTIDHIAIENQYHNISKSTFIKKGTIQIEKGTTATQCVPHEEQTAEFTLVEGQKMFEGDYLADDGIHHVYTEVTLDGSEDETLEINNNLSTTNYTAFMYNKSNIIKSPNETSINLYCNKLLRDSSNHRTSNKQNCWVNHFNSGQIGFHLPNTITTVEELRTYLLTNNLTFVYKLKEEVIEPYTELQQVQYNALKRIFTYSPQTNITVTSTDLKPIMTLSYKKIENNE